MCKQTVLITGASRGIGKAIAETYAKNGHNVILNCRHNKEVMDKVVLQLRKSNENVIGIQADVSDYEQAAHMFKSIPPAFGCVDVLINNAGIAHLGLFTDMTPKSWQHITDTNLYSVFNCSHAALPHMVRSKKGVITNISSVWGNEGASCEAVYAATKGGLNSFTKSLAKELALSGIRVNAIACGVIATEMNDCLSPCEKDELANEIPMGRFGNADEIASVAYFLSSPAAAYVTGQIINVDGGMF